MGGSVVSFCFFSWDVAISFARSLGCGRGLLFGSDVVAHLSLRSARNTMGTRGTPE